MEETKSCNLCEEIMEQLHILGDNANVHTQHLGNMRMELFRAKSLADIRWKMVMEMHQKVMYLESTIFQLCVGLSVILAIICTIAVIKIDLLGVARFFERMTGSTTECNRFQNSPEFDGVGLQQVTKASERTKSKKMKDSWPKTASENSKESIDDMESLKTTVHALTHQLQALHERVLELECDKEDYDEMSSCGVTNIDSLDELYVNREDDRTAIPVEIIYIRDGPLNSPISCFTKQCVHCQ